MGWFWLALVAAALLFVGAGSVPRGDSAIEVGLLLAALAALLWGVIKGLSVAGDKEPTVPSNPNNPNNPGVDPIPVTGIQFGRFNRQVSGDDIPWCVATRYRITYVVNGVESDPGPSVDVEPSLTKTDPVFTLNRPFGVDEVKWYRAVDPNLDVWYEHTSQMEEVLGEPTGVYYIDRFNPCEVPYVPDAPSTPVPYGEIEYKWNAIAGPGVVPWCMPTRYRARYVKGGNISAWSEYSDEFQSMDFTYPGVRVDPLNGYQVEWETTPPPPIRYITVPCTPSGGDTCDPHGFVIVRRPSGATIGGMVSLERVWFDGSNSLTMPINDFVSLWNSLGLSNRHREVGTLRASPEGRLFLTPFQTPDDEPLTVHDASLPWWSAMGFGTTGLWSNREIRADRLPNGSSLQNNDTSTHIYIDVSNPCFVPNPPTTEPTFVRWGVPATMSSPRNEFPWCEPTSYRYSFVVNEVESDWSPESEWVSHDQNRDPIMFVQSPSGANIKWYRAEYGKDGWYDHTEAMEKKESISGSGYRYIDRVNPCSTPWRPNPPNIPVPNGAFLGLWNAEAGEGLVPWCIPTRYRARYVREGQESDWSDYTNEFWSSDYTQPSLALVDPRPDFDVEWESSTRQQGVYITLPCTYLGTNPPNFCFHGGTIIIYVANFPVLETFDFSDIWQPGQTTLTVTVREFVQAWNSKRRLFPALRIAPSGMLIMDPMNIGAANRAVRIDDQSMSWWDAMGFSRNGIVTGREIQAVSLPAGPQSIIVGGGHNFVDVNNPCASPNPPRSAPRWVEFDRKFTTNFIQ
jgi:hypothetical protein